LISFGLLLVVINLYNEDMGGGSSTAAGNQGTLEEQAENLFSGTPYFIRGATIDSEDLVNAKQSWNAIVEGEQLP
jgi:hypothetical protein